MCCWEYIYDCEGCCAPSQVGRRRFGPPCGPAGEPCRTFVFLWAVVEPRGHTCAPCLAAQVPPAPAAPASPPPLPPRFPPASWANLTPEQVEAALKAATDGVGATGCHAMSIVSHCPPRVLLLRSENGSLFVMLISLVRVSDQSIRVVGQPYQNPQGSVWTTETLGLGWDRNPRCFQRRVLHKSTPSFCPSLWVLHQKPTPFGGIRPRILTDLGPGASRGATRSYDTVCKCIDCLHTMDNELTCHS